jgi:c(7)-type cytochrome triheme protein
MTSLRARAITGIGLLVTITAVFVHTAVAQDNPNAFNRLMKPPSERNAPPEADGIHDPTADGTLMLQPPQESFAGLPKSRSGNYVNWSKAVENGLVDVVYPHKQHTQWLDCSNCHPAIFIPMKGANQISMASILMGEKCGVCHGKVAFPVSECRRCHSKPKPVDRP